MFEKQKGRCWICQRHQVELKTMLYVDHDHITGAVRGLLCPRCNTSVGFIETNNIDRVMQYIKHYRPASELKSGQYNLVSKHR